VSLTRPDGPVAGASPVRHIEGAKPAHGSSIAAEARFVAAGPIET